jgi:DNA-directed RNA polymerase specialized sigma24 family protein
VLDLVRHFHGPQGQSVRLESWPSGTTGPAELEPPERADPSDDLERWSAFHEGVARLPAEEREVVGPVFYHGWTQAGVAELLQVSERTVRRRWESALFSLRGVLGSQEP